MILFRAQRLVSSAGGAVIGTPVFIGGKIFSVHMSGPASISQVDESNDKTSWALYFAGTGFAVRPASGSGEGGNPLWIRPIVPLDASGPRVFLFNFAIKR